MKSKLSPLQAQIIEDLKNGGFLRSQGNYAFFVLRSDDLQWVRDMTIATFQALLDKGVIRKIRDFEEEGIHLMDYGAV